MWRWQKKLLRCRRVWGYGRSFFLIKASINSFFLVTLCASWERPSLDRMLKSPRELKSWKPHSEYRRYYWCWNKIKNERKIWHEKCGQFAQMCRLWAIYVHVYNIHTTVLFRISSVSQINYNTMAAYLEKKISP